MKYFYCAELNQNHRTTGESKIIHNILLKFYYKIIKKISFTPYFTKFPNFTTIFLSVHDLLNYIRKGSFRFGLKLCVHHF